ncbi:major facilitator superfamily domain-containing protein [Scleroderma yunnanense]
MSFSRTSSDAPLSERGHLLHAEGIRTPLPVDEDGEGGEDHDNEVASWKRRPWWKRPSPYWIVFAAPITAIGFSAAFAPRVEVYTSLACRVHKPQYSPQSLSPPSNQPLDFSSFLHPYGEEAAHNTKSGGNHSSLLFVSSSADRVSGTRFEENPQTRKKCATDPDVQAAVATVLATLITTMGILSCLVTGWWGMFCDRHGRRPVLAASVFGLLLNELNFIITANFVDYLPGRYWFLLAGFVTEGLLGSLSSEVTASHAYMADTSGLSSRTRIFALELGLKFAGFAVGPLIGGIIIRFTGSTLSVFFLAVSLHFICALFILFILPESLTDIRGRIARLRYKEEKDESANTPVVLRIVKEGTMFFSALTVLVPQDTVSGNLHRRPRKDWNLLLLTICYGLNTSFHASLPFLFQYAIATFDWAPEITNYYFASIGVSHALVLTVILPSLTHSSKLDLALARCALAIGVFSCLVMAITSSGTLFAIGTMIASVSITFPPIAQALALEIYNHSGVTRTGVDEAGKLFGAMSVVQTLGMQVIGPTVYGYVYSHTVATFPQAIMFMSVFNYTLAFVLLVFVRTPVPSRGPILDRDTELRGNRDDDEIGCESRTVS